MRNYEWSNFNALRKYPIQTNCTPHTKDKLFTLPNSVIVDAVLQMSYEWQQQFYISKIDYSPLQFYIEISQAETSNLALQGILTGTTIFLTGVNPYTYSVGKIIIGSLDDLPYGSYEFYPYSTLLEPCNVLKLNSGIASLNGITDGNINLVSQTNVVITKTGSNIVIDTQDGLCACDENPCIKSINGIYAKNFLIDGTGCVKVNNGTNGIIIENTCESSCCGCTEINDMLDRINDLSARITALGG